MKNRIAIKLSVILTAALVLCLSAAISAYAAGNFIIRDYDVDMVVNEDDTYLVTETVSVEFTAPSHGIYVNIPLSTDLDRDGQRSQYSAKVKDFRMLSDQPYSVKSSSSQFSVKIGDPDKYASTETVYQYSYLYDTGGDHLKDADEVYHNLVGTSWEAQSIDHVSFEVAFPKPIDMDDIGIKTGSQVYVPFEAVDDRTLQGETTENCLGGLTIRAVLPQGYFTREARNPAWLFWGLTGILALAAAGGLVLWRRYGRDPVYPVTLEFNPPEDLTAPEVAYLANGVLNSSDVVSILFTLADKGYLKIREYQGETGKKKKKVTDCYEIQKLKDYDGDVIGEKTFMDGLFAEGDTIEVEDLENKFYKTIDEIKKEIYDKYEGRLYDDEAASKANVMYAAGWIGLAALYVLTRITGVTEGAVGLILTIAPVFFVGSGFQTIAKTIRDKKKIGSYIPGIISVGIGLFLSIGNGSIKSGQLVPFFICLVFCLLLFIMGGLCERKTEWYAGITAKIEGFREFLKTAEKDQMETLADNDPGYYYRNLAFAFALGVTAVYAKRFISMASKAPEWFDTYHYGSDGYQAARMADSLNSMANSVSSSMTSSPSSGSGGGSFSGGGGGGGSGGGSW